MSLDLATASLWEPGVSGINPEGDTRHLQERHGYYIQNYLQYNRLLCEHKFIRFPLFRNFKMQFGRNVTSLLASLEVTASKREEAGQCLDGFDQLSAEQQQETLPSIMDKVFQLIFGDEVAIQNSPRYQSLHQKPWQVTTLKTDHALATHFLTSVTGLQTAISHQKSLSPLLLLNKYPKSSRSVAFLG